MDGWKKVKLTDLGTIARGKSKHRPRDASHLYGGQYPFIQTGDVKEANHKITSFKQTYSEAGLNQSKIWPVGTICITIAANIAETGILTFPACFPDSVIGFIANKEVCDVDYVEYMLQYFKKQVQRYSIGSVQENINLDTFKRVEFLVPPLKEQQAIASILSSLDDKIELNLQMNKTLEEMAMALYKEWFVDFGPFKDGNFVGSELGLIPEGWEVKQVRDYGKVVTGKTPSSKTPEYFGSEIPFVTPTDFKNYGRHIFNAERGISQLGIDNNLNKIISANSIVVTCIGSDMGKVAISKTNCLTNQQINSLIPQESYCYIFLYCFFISQYNLLRTLAGDGTTMPIINKTSFENIRIISPLEDILIKFNSSLLEYDDLMYSNAKENGLLTQTRDNLLPKLISGEIRVKDIEKEITEVL